jgi:pilus assembly protein Flp/PilA
MFYRALEGDVRAALHEQIYGSRPKGGERMPIAKRVAAHLKRLYRETTGQGLAEYALILALIAIISIVALLFMGSQVSSKLSIIGSTIGSVNG